MKKTNWMKKPRLSKPELNPNHKKSRTKRVEGSEVKELLTLLVLNQKSPIGRYRLKAALGLSEHEGLVKQMLVELQKQGYISANKSGCTLTQNGKTLLWRRLKDFHIKEIKAFDLPPFRAGSVSIGLHLENMADKIGSAMAIRDDAIRGGATGATIIFFKEGKLCIPSVNSNFLSENPALIKKMQDSFKLEDNDVIAIVSAEDEWKGFEASITVAKTLFQSAYA